MIGLTSLATLVIIFATKTHQVAVRQTSSEIPSFLKICHQSDPNLNECIKKSVETIKPYLKSGIPSLHIPPCEPLNVPQIEVKQAGGPVSLKATYKNIRVLRGTEFVLKNVKLDLANDRLKLKLMIPRLEVFADYHIEGKILMLPIRGHGLARGNYTDIDVIVTISGERYQDRQTGKVHFLVNDFFVDFDIGQAKVHLNNLFNGDEVLSEAMNNFLNDNWKTVSAELRPSMEKTVSNLFKNFSNKIYAKFPLDVLLPP